MDDYVGRLLADRYRMPRLPTDEYELAESRAYDTASGQEVLVRQVPLPEVVDAEVVGAVSEQAGSGGVEAAAGARQGIGRQRAAVASRRPLDPVVQRAVEAAVAASRIPDHPRLDQVFDVFVEGDGLWIVSELVHARPLSVLLAEQPLSPYRAAEIAADVLAALRVVHAYGWTHRNITARTVLICEDGRALLTGLAVGAAQEALSGYDPLPTGNAFPPPSPSLSPDAAMDPDDEGMDEGFPPSGAGGGLGPPEGRTPPERTPEEHATNAFGVPLTKQGSAAATRAARSDAIAAYRAGTRAGADATGRGSRPPEHPGAPAGVPAPRGHGGPARGGDGRLRSGDRGDPRGGGDLGGSGAAGLARPHSKAWGETGDTAADNGRYRGPDTALAAERARQARMTTVGAVTERWAPEQAGPVYEHWRLAPPVGPAADLWALGALLFRAVQGHPPYPEDEGTRELVQMVCAEPPAYAEECGALRPVVESLLRQDPTERPDFEELRGWLRSMVRSAPEPDVGRRTIAVPPMPDPGAPADPRRLPVLRRRGELVRRLRTEKSPVAVHGRHKRGRSRPRRPRHLGRLLVGLVLLGLASAMLYAVLFMPRANQSGPQERRGPVGSTVPQDPQQPSGQEPQGAQPQESQPQESQPQGTTAPPETAPEGYTVRKDPAGFRIAVPDDWDRRGRNDRGQVRYLGGGYELIVVPGRDTTAKFGDDPMAYQNQDEAELEPYRSADWSSASGLRRIDVGQQAMAEGEFTWRDGSGRQVFVENRAVILDGRYHLVLVRGPENKRDEVREYFTAAADSYRAGG